MMIHPAREAKIVLLLAEKITVLIKYADFVNVFLKELTEVLLKQTNINEHAI